MDTTTADPSENIDSNEIRSKYKELNEKCEKILKRIKDKNKTKSPTQGK